MEGERERGSSGDRGSGVQSPGGGPRRWRGLRLGDDGVLQVRVPGPERGGKEGSSLVMEAPLRVS